MKISEVPITHRCQRRTKFPFWVSYDSRNRSTKLLERWSVAMPGGQPQVHDVRFTARVVASTLLVAGGADAQPMTHEHHMPPQGPTQDAMQSHGAMQGHGMAFVRIWPEGMGAAMHAM